jgi:hypothetical protein
LIRRLSAAALWSKASGGSITISAGHDIVSQAVAEPPFRVNQLLLASQIDLLPKKADEYFQIVISYFTLSPHC